MFLLLSILMSVTLPSPDEVVTISAGQQAALDVSEGECWIRILEDDYVCLRVSASESVRLAAFDETGGILCQAEPGDDMVLSAFSDYWFYLQLKSDPGRISDFVTVSVQEVPSEAIGSGEEVRSVIPRNSMAESFIHVPQETGTWTFRLEGTGGTDLDLEVFGPDMRVWGSSMSLEGFETVTVPVLRDEEVTVLVSRYGKGGSGDFVLSVEPSGQFPELSSSSMEGSMSPGEIRRYLLAEHDDPLFLNLVINSYGADVDLILRDMQGEYLMGSQSYSSIEALLLPPADGPSVADVVLYDPGDNESVGFDLLLNSPGTVYSSIPVKEVLDAGSPASAPVGFAPLLQGLYSIGVEFEKTRDGDVRIFRREGEPSLTFASSRGNEEFLLHVSAGDTVWIDPFFEDVSTGGNATLRIAPADAVQLEGEYSGHISEEDPTAFFRAPAQAGTILDIALHGQNREVDLDLFVTGPDFDLIAEGWLSNVDAAGDEAVEVYVEEDGEYGITVYLYERQGETPFSLNVNRIDHADLAEPSPGRETWALLAGISGYASAADILNRASMDAVEFYYFLTRDQEVPEDHVILLVDALATRDRFLDGVSSLLHRAGPEDRVVVFYSGHGDQSYPGSGGPEEPDSANESICLYDDDVSDDELSRMISDSSRAAVFLFFDACHSGGFVNDFEEGSNVMVLTAAREDLSVSERILTPILLQGSRGDADGNGNGYVSALELMTYIDEKLQLICPECDAQLTPETFVCPECGAVLKGENAVPRPQQGMYLDEDVELWEVR